MWGGSFKIGVFRIKQVFNKKIQQRTKGEFVKQGKMKVVQESGNILLQDDLCTCQGQQQQESSEEIIIKFLLLLKQYKEAKKKSLNCSQSKDE